MSEYTPPIYELNEDASAEEIFENLNEIQRRLDYEVHRIENNAAMYGDTTYGAYITYGCYALQRIAALNKLGYCVIAEPHIESTHTTVWKLVKGE